MRLAVRNGYQDGREALHPRKLEEFGLFSPTKLELRGKSAFYKQIREVFELLK